MSIVCHDLHPPRPRRRQGGYRRHRSEITVGNRGWASVLPEPDGDGRASAPWRHPGEFKAHAAGPSRGTYGRHAPKHQRLRALARNPLDSGRMDERGQVIPIRTTEAVASWARRPATIARHDVPVARPLPAAERSQDPGDVARALEVEVDANVLVGGVRLGPRIADPGGGDRHLEMLDEGVDRTRAAGHRHPAHRLPVHRARGLDDEGDEGMVG